jgi:hypothetical protein
VVSWVWPESGTARSEDSVKKANVVATAAPGVYKLEDGSYRVVAHVGNSRLSQRRKEKRLSAGTGIREMNAKPDGKSPETIQKVFAALESRVQRQNRGRKTMARAQGNSAHWNATFTSDAARTGSRVRRS